MAISLLSSGPIKLGRGIIGGLAWSVIGLVGLPVGIAAFTYVAWQVRGSDAFDRQYDIDWWQSYGVPTMVVIPMLLFFTGLVTHSLQRRVSFALNLAILAISSFPFAAILGSMGMARPRLKASSHPPMYLSEVLMFLIPLTVVSCILIMLRSDHQPGETNKL